MRGRRWANVTTIATPARKLKLAATALGAAFVLVCQAQTNTSPITLETALRLAGAQNLDVQIARERVKEAKALHEQARMNYFPWIAPGIVYKRHDGNIQDVTGNIFNTSKQSYGIGASITAQVELGETIYKSLAARQAAQAAEEAAEAKRQETVFAAATGYFELSRAQGGVGTAQEAVRIASDYAAQVKRAADAGIAFKGDAYRAQVQVEKNQMLLRQAQEQRRIAAARLAQTLRLPSAADLMPQETELAPLTLVATNAALDSLVTRAQASRPELRQLDFLAQSADTTRRGATRGPWIPSIGASAYLGGLGGGRNGSTSNFDDTQDYFLGLSWKFGPGGVGDRGRVRVAESRQQASRLEIEKARQDIERQVVEAHTRVHSLADQFAMAKRALASATELLKLSAERKEFGVGAVLETIQAEQELTRARLDYLNLLAAHNQAQYALLRAVGDGAK